MIKILVVSHDAGGGNILSSLIKKYHRNFNWITCVSGPAKKIFLKNRINLLADQISFKYKDIKSVLGFSKPDLILTSTSWESDFDINFIREARKNNIKTSSFLDHWCNYKERFDYPANWKKNLPDFIFVGDKWAYKIALKNGFPQKKLLQVENPYLEEIFKQSKKTKWKKKNDDNKIRMLYVSQPVFSHAKKKYKNPNYWGYTEYKIIDDLLKILNQNTTETQLKLKIRLHPSEDINKYSNLLRNQKYSKIKKFIAISNPAKNPLVKDCCWADAVIGSGSMALVIAHLLGKKAISYMPTDKKINFLKQKYSLPPKGIKKIYSRKALLEEIKRFKKKPWPKIRRPNIFFKKKLFAKAVSNICP